MLCVLYYCGSGVIQRCDWQLEAEVDTGRPHDRQLVNAGEGEAVEIEDVVAVVYVGDAEVDLEDGTFADGKFAFGADVETVCSRRGGRRRR